MIDCPEGAQKTEVHLVYPHQLFRRDPEQMRCRRAVLVEDPLFFRQFQFHSHKLVLHRASLRWYADDLTRQQVEWEYIPCSDHRSQTNELFRWLAGSGVQTVYLEDVCDYLLMRRIRRYARIHGVQIVENDSPSFLLPIQTISTYASKKRFFMADFYKTQRKSMNILLNGKGEPVGGQWSFDEENRKAIPRGTLLPVYPSFGGNAYVDEAVEYIRHHFPSAPGRPETFNLPVTRAEALRSLDVFMDQRFANWGRYQDALVPGQPFLFHSLLSSSINCGLLTPREVIDAALSRFAAGDIPLNAVEGFVRQIIGWREYIRVVYALKGTEERKRNFWEHHRRIPESFWKGTTGIPPVDDCIRQVLDHGYTHHIGRLMVLGNFMLLCEFDPEDVYSWFMALFVDAYDWVMVPNVYGMSQFADGGVMSTKPYISGSGYILKMGSYEKGKWCEVWDALFWRFIHIRRDFFLRNPRMAMMVRTWDKMSAEKRNSHLITAENWLSSLDSK